MQEIYINLFTSFGFQRVFGEESSKVYLISFLNTLLPERHQIQELQFNANEYQGSTVLKHKAILELNCISSSGEFFIVELQKEKHNFFKRRNDFYETFPIQKQAQQAELNCKFSAVYTIGILDFIFDDEDSSARQDVVHQVQLKDQSNQVFYDKLTFIYLTLPNFTKSEDELETLQDKWFFLFRHLHELDEIPPRLRERVFLSLFEKASIARFQPEERQAYESSLKYYRDLKNVIDTAREEGVEEGREQGREQGLEEGLEVGREEGYQQAKAEAEEKNSQAVIKMLDKGMTAEEISDLLGLTMEQVQHIQESYSNQ